MLFALDALNFNDLEELASYFRSDYGNAAGIYGKAFWIDPVFLRLYPFSCENVDYFHRMSANI